MSGVAIGEDVAVRQVSGDHRRGEPVHLGSFRELAVQGLNQPQLIFAVDVVSHQVAKRFGHIGDVRTVPGNVGQDKPCDFATATERHGVGITAARVPMIFATPDGKPGTTTSLAELVELFPSLTDLCGLKTLVKLDGVIQVPVLKDVSKSVKRSAFTQHPRPADFDRTESKMPEAMGSSDRIATHRSTEWRAGKDGKLVGGERYALDTDPAELDNVVKSPESAAPPKAALQALHRQFPPDTPPSKR